MCGCVCLFVCWQSNWEVLGAVKLGKLAVTNFNLWIILSHQQHYLTLFYFMVFTLYYQILAVHDLSDSIISWQKQSKTLYFISYFIESVVMYTGNVPYQKTGGR